MKLYPAIDLMGGRCVRLRQGKFDEKTEYALDPVEQAQRYAAAGATNLHVVDLDGARDGNAKQTPLIARIVRECGLEVQVGGGIRSAEQALALFEAGVARVVVGSLAVTQPEKMHELLEKVGPGRVTLAVDVADGEVATHGWTKGSGRSVNEVVESYRAEGLGHVLCTDIGRDGMLGGPNVDLYVSLQAAFPEMEIQASGGIGGLNDLVQLRAMGVKAAIIGKALYEGRFTIKEALSC